MIQAFSKLNRNKTHPKKKPPRTERQTDDIKQWAKLRFTRFSRRHKCQSGAFGSGSPLEIGKNRFSMDAEHKAETHEQQSDTDTEHKIPDLALDLISLRYIFVFL